MSDHVVLSTTYQQANTSTQQKIHLHHVTPEELLTECEHFWWQGCVDCKRSVFEIVCL